MSAKRKYLGRWEFGCLVFHSCFYKMFTTYPEEFFRISGTAGWLTALYTGLIFLGVFSLVLCFVKRYGACIPKALIQIGKAVLALYWLLSAAYALGEYTYVLSEVAFPRSPKWFLGGILLLGAAVTVLCGGKAVYRMHSLTVLGVGLSMTAVAVLGLKYAQPVYLTPWLGKGAGAVFGTGLSTLFFYTDSILIFQLVPECRRDVSVFRSGITGAILAVALNVALVLVSSMSHSAALSQVSANLIYPLTKAAYFGNFWSRMDAVYLLALTTSGFLYLSLALHLFFLAVKDMSKIPKSAKKVTAACLAGILPLSMTGCYDSREVEAAAYAVALGIDKGTEKQFEYTFQLSNPLELGGSTETTSGEAQSGEEEEPQENKTVSNITIEEDSFYLAMNHLKSHLSKEPDFSHLKLLVFSMEVSKEGILEHASLLFKEQEVRPATQVCLTDSANKFLKGVKPTLEQSTARYYELLFRDRNTPYAPVMELREFVSRGTDGGWDPVLPVATTEKLTGIGIFQKGKLVAAMDEKAALLYSLLSGEGKEIAVPAGDSTFSVTSSGRASFELEGNKVFVRSNLTAQILAGQEEDYSVLTEMLEEEMTNFLRETVKLKTDVSGIGAWIRSGMMEEKEWKHLNWHKTIQKLEPVSQLTISYRKI